MDKKERKVDFVSSLVEFAISWLRFAGRLTDLAISIKVLSVKSRTDNDIYYVNKPLLQLVTSTQMTWLYF